MDVSFMMDILITFNTGFYKTGYLVMKWKDIVKNYLLTWFILDIFASFPYAWIANDTPGDENQGNSSGNSAAAKTP